ncbi:MAG: hypothetical protein WDW38_006421 [Sanguina aurantia]
MNWANVVILGVLALSVLIGLFRGLVAEILSLVIWVAAFWATWAFGPIVAVQLQHAITLPSLRNSVAYGLCFVTVLILGAIIRFMVKRLIWSSGLSGIDRMFGMVFGFARGVLIVTVLVFLVGMTGLTREAWWKESALAPQFQSAAAWLGQATTMCGIIGIVGTTEVAAALYDGLTVLQHRGQDAAGIATVDGARLRLHKGNGLVRDVFGQAAIAELRGRIGIGHCRYPTAGSEGSAEAQPFYVNSPYGIAFVPPTTATW